MTTTHTLRALAMQCGASIKGDGEVLISGIASIASAQPGSLVFAADAGKLEEALRSPATAIIAGEFADHVNSTKPILLARDPRLAFALVSRLFSQGEHRQGRHASAQVHPSAIVGERTWVGANVMLDEGVRIGEGSSMESNCVIGAGVAIGCDCRIGPNVTIYSGTALGNRVAVQAGTVLGSAGFGYVPDEHGHYHLFPQIGRLIIEDDVEIGANCTIDRGALDATVIRRGAKLDNMVHVGHNVEIGENVVIAAQTGISGSSVIESNAIIAGQVGIADHVRIGTGAILGAQSGVPSNKVVRGNGIVFWGTPARPLKDYLKQLSVLARLSRQRQK
jgi:UDP-3-O-[3-hydroxymyristoyl] glucosamine N-acyltransferase